MAASPTAQVAAGHERSQAGGAAGALASCPPAALRGACRCPSATAAAVPGPLLTRIGICKLDLQRVAQHGRAVQRADGRLRFRNGAVPNKAIAASRRTGRTGVASGTAGGPGRPERRAWRGGLSATHSTCTLPAAAVARLRCFRQASTGSRGGASCGRYRCAPQAVLGDRVADQAQRCEHAKLAKHRCDLVLAPLQGQAPAQMRDVGRRAGGGCQ